MKNILLLAMLALAACVRPIVDSDEEPPPLTTVGYVDLDRYMGRWYLMANIPNFAEQGNIAPYVEYSRRADGRIDDKYTALEKFGGPPFTKDGYIEITSPMTGAEGRITFLQPLWRDYAVIYLDPDYRYTVVGLQDRDYIWLFAREPRLSDEVFQTMVA